MLILTAAEKLQCFTRSNAHNIRGSQIFPFNCRIVQKVLADCCCAVGNINTIIYKLLSAQCWFYFSSIFFYSFLLFSFLFLSFSSFHSSSVVASLFASLFNIIPIVLLLLTTFSAVACSLRCLYMSVCKHFVWMKWMWNLIISTYRLCYWIHTLCWVRIMRISFAWRFSMSSGGWLFERWTNFDAIISCF